MGMIFQIIVQYYTQVDCIPIFRSQINHKSHHTYHIQSSGILDYLFNFLNILSIVTSLPGPLVVSNSLIFLPKVPKPQLTNYPSFWRFIICLEEPLLSTFSCYAVVDLQVNMGDAVQTRPLFFKMIGLKHREPQRTNFPKYC